MCIILSAMYLSVTISFLKSRAQQYCISLLTQFSPNYKTHYMLLVLFVVVFVLKHKYIEKNRMRFSYRCPSPLIRLQVLNSCILTSFFFFPAAKFADQFILLLSAIYWGPRFCSAMHHGHYVELSVGNDHVNATAE